MSKTVDYGESQRIVNMRAREAARYIGCGLSTIWLYVKQGKIKAYKISDRVTIFKKEDLDNFINISNEVA